MEIFAGIEEVLTLLQLISERNFMAIEKHLELTGKVDKLMNKIEKKLEEIYDSGSLSLLQVLCVLSDGGPMQWSEIESRVRISKPALSRRLKYLTKRNIVKREIIPAFPPKTRYQLNKDKVSENWMKLFEYMAKKLYSLDRQCRSIIAYGFLIYELYEKNNLNIKELQDEINLFLNSLYTLILNDLGGELEYPMSGERPIEEKLFRLKESYSYTKLFLTMIEGFSISDDLKNILVKMVDEHRNNVFARSQSKKEKEILHQLTTV